MIYGVGTDLIEIKRVERVLARFGERFAQRILCEPELKRFRAHKQPVSYLAKRFAAKEAFTKALGTGIHAPANWHGVWVKNLPSGKPTMKLTGGAADRLAAITPPGMTAQIDLTITDDGPQAQAFVIISALPAGVAGPHG